MTLPNLVTVIRIILAPILVIYLLQDRFLHALIVFILAGLSDGVDGLIARLFDQKSRLGAVMDPLADKILLVSAFVVLAVRGLLPAWLTVVVISRDVLILLGVLILYLNDANLRIRPSLLSKLSTCLQLGCVFVVLAQNYLHWLAYLRPAIYWAAGFMTVTSGLHYIRYWMREVSESGLGE